MRDSMSVCMKKLFKYILKVLIIFLGTIILSTIIFGIIIKVNYQYKLYVIYNAFNNHSDQMVELCGLMTTLGGESGIFRVASWDDDIILAYSGNGIRTELTPINFGKFQPYKSDIENIMSKIKSLSMEAVHLNVGDECEYVFFGGGVLGSDFGLLYSTTVYDPGKRTFHTLRKLDDKGEWYFYID